jgi:hypothetical protein
MGDLEVIRFVAMDIITKKSYHASARMKRPFSRPFTDRCSRLSPAVSTLRFKRKMRREPRSSPKVLFHRRNPIADPHERAKSADAAISSPTPPGKGRCTPAAARGGGTGDGRETEPIPARLESSSPDREIRQDGVAPSPGGLHPCPKLPGFQSRSAATRMQLHTSGPVRAAYPGRDRSESFPPTPRPTYPARLGRLLDKESSPRLFPRASPLQSRRKEFVAWGKSSNVMSAVKSITRAISLRTSVAPTASVKLLLAPRATDRRA